MTQQILCFLPSEDNVESQWQSSAGLIRYNQFMQRFRWQDSPSAMHRFWDGWCWSSARYDIACNVWLLHSTPLTSVLQHHQGCFQRNFCEGNCQQLPLKDRSSRLFGKAHACMQHPILAVYCQSSSWLKGLAISSVPLVGDTIMTAVPRQTWYTQCHPDHMNQCVWWPCVALLSKLTTCCMEQSCTN